MANPQLEDGRTEIANELVDTLAKTYFSPAESKIVWSVFRKTYGWHKKSDHISYSQFEEMTGLDKRHIGAPLQRLIDRKIIFSSNAGERRMSEFGIQKNWELWQLTPEPVTKSDTGSGVKLAPETVTEDKTYLLPIQGQSDTSVGQSDTTLGPNLLPKVVTTKANNKSILQKQTTKANYIFILPDWIDKNTWDRFVEMRTIIKHPLTDYGKHLIISDLEKLKLAGNEPIRVLEESIKRGWQGVFPLLENKNNGGNQNGYRKSQGFANRGNESHQGNNRQHSIEDYERAAANLNG